MITTPASYNAYPDERHVTCSVTVSGRTFTQDDIRSLKLHYSASHTSEAVPGSELTFEVDNTTDAMAFFQGLATNTEIAVSLAIDGNAVNMGTFLYIGISFKSSELIAEISARDYMESLDDVTATDIGNWSTLSEAVAVLLPGVAVEYESDLGDTPLQYGYDAETTKREALRQLAQAACCSCWYTRDGKLRFQSLAAGWEGVDTIDGDKLDGWDILSFTDEFDQVTLTTNLLEKYFYFDSNDNLETSRWLGSAVIPAKSVGWLRYDKPGEMKYVQGTYDATDMSSSGWWSQLGVKVLQSTIYGLKLKTPRGLIWESDPWKIYLSGIEYGVTATEYTAGSGDKVKAVTNNCVPSGRATSVAEWLKLQYDRREKYTLSYRGNPATEIGDTVTVINKAGASCLATVTDIQLTYDGGLSATMVCIRKSVGKDPGVLTVTPSSITLNADNPTATVSIYRPGDGVVSASISDNTIADLSLTGNALVVTGKGHGGVATITISCGEGTYHTAPADAKCYVQAVFTPANFAEATWPEIIAACQANEVPDTWNVGDSTTMLIDGTSYQVDVIGKAHDTYTAGGTAPLTFQLHDIVQKSSYDGSYLSPNQKLWAECGLRTGTLPAILAKMPSEVQSAIKEVNKVSVSSWEAASSGKLPAKTYAEGLFILSEYEITGSGSTAPAEGSQYAYYKAGNSKIKKYSGTATAWWTRSADTVTGTNYYGAHAATADGKYTSVVAANTSCGVAPAWCF